MTMFVCSLVFFLLMVGNAVLCLKEFKDESLFYLNVCCALLWLANAAMRAREVFGW